MMDDGMQIMGVCYKEYEYFARVDGVEKPPGVRRLRAAKPAPRRRWKDLLNRLSSDKHLQLTCKLV